MSWHHQEDDNREASRSTTMNREAERFTTRYDLVLVALVCRHVVSLQIEFGSIGTRYVCEHDDGMVWYEICMRI